MRTPFFASACAALHNSFLCFLLTFILSRRSLASHGREFARRCATPLFASFCHCPFLGVFDLPWPRCCFPELFFPFSHEVCVCWGKLMSCQRFRVVLATPDLFLDVSFSFGVIFSLKSIFHPLTTSQFDLLEFSFVCFHYPSKSSPMTSFSKNLVIYQRLACPSFVIHLGFTFYSDLAHAFVSASLRLLIFIPAFLLTAHLLTHEEYSSTSRDVF